MINVCNRPKSELGRLFSLHTLSFSLITDPLAAAPPMDPASRWLRCCRGGSGVVYPSVSPGWVGFTLGVGFSVGSFVAGASLGTTLGVSLPPPPPECLRSLDVLEFSFGVSALVVSKMVIVPSSATFTSKLLAGLLACGRRTMCHRFQTYKEFR